MQRFRLVAAIALSVACALLAVGAVAGCSDTAGQTVVVVTEQDAGTTISMSKGGALSVQLAGNPSTGFSWMPTDTPQFLAVQGEPTFESGSTGGAVVGAGGMQTTVFKATATGKGKLTMEYIRPWETGVAPAKTFSVTVDAK